MTVTDLVSALRADLGDDGKVVFSDPALERCVRRALYPVGRDLGITFTIAEGSISPTPTGPQQEALLLMASINACEQMRVRSAGAVRTWKTGEQTVERGDQAKSWADLEADLRARYGKLVGDINPSGDEYWIKAPDVTPQVYEAGSAVE